MGLILLSFRSMALELDPQWKSLLYVDGDSNLVDDPSFYIESSQRDLIKELQNVISVLESKEDSQLICRFPARFYWVNQRYKIRKEVSYNHCLGLQTFLRKAPAEKISVVFASENISIPSSMMGHIYIQLEGHSEDRDVSHLISYFTDAADGNLFKLVYETVFVGKEGYYALLAGNSLTDKYLSAESRNIWKYELRLTPFQRKLLHLHLYELKGIKLKYFFHKFNCATLVYRILKTTYPNIKEVKRPWITPLDVVRTSFHSSIISSQSVELSDSWKIKALIFSNAVSSDQVGNVLEYKVSLENSSYQERELYRSYLNYRQQHVNDDSPITASELNKFSLSEKDKGKSLDLSLYKAPFRTKSTAFIGLGYNQFGDRRYANLDFMPASHMLEDDSSQYLNDSELQISKMSLAVNKDAIKVNEFSLYSSSMLMPSDRLTGGISSDYGIGYLNFVGQSLREVSLVAVRGKIGKTYRLHSDFDVFLLTGARVDSNLEVAPVIDLGFSLHSIFNTKIIFNLKDEFFSKHSFEQVKSASLKVGIDLGNYMLIGKSAIYKNSRTEKIYYGLDFKGYF